MPPAADRVHGFTPLPLKCPHCATRIKLSPAQARYIPLGLVVQCSGCARLHYVVIVAQVHMAYICEIRAKEASTLVARGASPHQVLEHLGIVVRAA